ncbi:MAG TPA: response regulator [Vicinamibacterales bacterium]|nr:response regulator [Vicinamibacterales bacterium]
MADWSWANGGGDGQAPGWFGSELREVFDGASILLVEDDNDIRDLLSTLLQLAGFQTTACPTAEAALEELREQTFDLVLTDYMLPNRTGGWLLQQAANEGLIDATPVLVVTAHPNPPDVVGYEVIQKPFDLDDLVSRVRQRLDNGNLKRPRLPLTSAPSSKRPGDTDGGECPDPVELILYVSAHSPRSAAAVANIKRALARFESSRVKLTICDLSDEPFKGEADSVAFTPTLVKRSPGPRTFILGHITNPDILLDLLHDCSDD